MFDKPTDAALATEELRQYLTIRGRAPDTIHEYCCRVKTYLGCDMNPLQWVSSAPGRAEIKMRRAAVLALYRMLGDDVLALARILPQPAPPPLPDYPIPSIELMLTMLAWADDHVRVEHALFIRVVYDSMCRFEELRSLPLTDFHRSACSFTIVGKGQKRRDPVITEETAALVEFYLDRLRPKRTSAIGFEPLFLSKSGQLLCEKALRESCWAMYKAHEFSLGNYKNPFHLLRHAGATHQLMLGQQEAVLIEQLGHSDINMLKRYLHLDLGARGAKHKRCSPLAQGASDDHSDTGARPDSVGRPKDRSHLSLVKAG